MSTYLLVDMIFAILMLKLQMTSPGPYGRYTNLPKLCCETL